MDCLEAVQSLQTFGFKGVAVLNMANRRKPGGFVKKGGDSQEEELYRRTDISKTTDRFLRNEGYPCSNEDTVMVQTGITIMRGPEKEGYPFLNDVPEVITVLSVAVKKKPTMYSNQKTGKKTLFGAK